MPDLGKMTEVDSLAEGINRNDCYFLLWLSEATDLNAHRGAPAGLCRVKRGGLTSASKRAPNFTLTSNFGV